MFSVNIKTGTKLRSKATGAVVEIIDMDFNMYEWTYAVKIDGITKNYSYKHILNEYDVIDEAPNSLHFGETTCSCGGMKTYNSRDKVYHSFYCYYGK